SRECSSLSSFPAATAIINRSLRTLRKGRICRGHHATFVKADLALGCAIVEQNASPPLQQNSARARDRRKYYQRRFLLDTHSPTPEFSVSTRVRRGQGSAGEILRRKNPERCSRPGFLSFRSY